MSSRRDLRSPRRKASRVAGRRSLGELRRPTDRRLSFVCGAELDRSPEQERIWAAMGTLRPKDRAVVVLRDHHDFSEAEIAIALHYRRRTVRSRLNYARAHLRKILPDGWQTDQTRNS